MIWGRRGFSVQAFMYVSTKHWSYADASHLLRRAAYGGTAVEVKKAVAAGRDGSVDALLAPESHDSIGLSSPSRLTLSGIIQWWVTRMLQAPGSLEERMTFFWHNHFATSIATVRHPELMLRQNQLLRKHALGNGRVLITEVARDPAMLLWLDNYLNRKEHPNENFGRELLELFSLGLNRYSEGDVLAAAKAFTGWTLTDETATGQYVFDEATHDAGSKAFLNHKGNWNGEDIVRIISSERTHARFLAAKLFAYFAYDDPPDVVVDRLADIYLRHDTEIKPLVREILTSPEMYSARARWSKVKSPIDHVIIACKQLAIEAEPSVVADVLNDQGLMLFSPPDVSGWTAGMTWINSWSLLKRMEFASMAAAAFDPVRLTDGQQFTTGKGVVDFYARLLGPLDLAPPIQKRLADYVAPRGVLPTQDEFVARQRGLVQLVLSLPESQRN
jgi:uncharacterized protein (DUF1800 family)